MSTVVHLARVDPFQNATISQASALCLSVREFAWTARVAVLYLSSGVMLIPFDSEDNDERPQSMSSKAVK